MIAPVQRVVPWPIHLSTSSTPFTHSRAPSSVSVAKVYVSVNCDLMRPRQRTVKLSFGMPVIGVPVAQSNWMFASFRISGAPVIVGFGQYSPANPNGPFALTVMSANAEKPLAPVLSVARAITRCVPVGGLLHAKVNGAVLSLPISVRPS